MSRAKKFDALCDYDKAGLCLNALLRCISRGQLSSHLPEWRRGLEGLPKGNESRKNPFVAPSMGLGLKTCSPEIIN